MASESGGAISDHVHAGAGTGGVLDATSTIVLDASNRTLSGFSRRQAKFSVSGQVWGADADAVPALIMALG